MSDQPKQPEQPSQPLAIDSSRSGMPSVPIGASGQIQPRDFDELYRVAKIVSASGLVPKDFANNPAACFVGMNLARELGLNPISGLQNIYVVNGRPTVFGDTFLGLCRSSPAWDESAFEEVAEGKPGTDSYGWRCTMKRKGGKSISRTFTVADAKRAKLWGKDGPWTFYPDRMLQMRARAFAGRDTFADVLRGLAVHEEVIDIEPIGARDVPVASKSLAQRIGDKVAEFKAQVEESAPPVEMECAVSESPTTLLPA